MSNQEPHLSNIKLFSRKSQLVSSRGRARSFSPTVFASSSTPSTTLARSPSPRRPRADPDQKLKRALHNGDSLQHHKHDLRDWDHGISESSSRNKCSRLGVCSLKFLEVEGQYLDHDGQSILQVLNRMRTGECEPCHARFSALSDHMPRMPLPRRLGMSPITIVGAGFENG